MATGQTKFEQGMLDFKFKAMSNNDFSEYAAPQHQEAINYYAQAQDLKQTNSLAQRMVGNYGMGKRLETFYNENIDNERTPFLGRSIGSGNKYSEKVRDLFDKESMELVNEAYSDAIRLLLENKPLMDIMIEELMKKNTLYGKDVSKLM
jgi:cell division protease FtsH